MQFPSFSMALGMRGSSNLQKVQQNTVLAADQEWMMGGGSQGGAPASTRSPRMLPELTGQCSAASTGPGCIPGALRAQSPASPWPGAAWY